jgi:hypothetical protein
MELLVDLRSIGILRMCRLRGSLLTDSLSLLLLLNTRSRLGGGRVFQVHWWHEGPSELLLSDEWVQFGLLW